MHSRSYRYICSLRSPKVATAAEPLCRSRVLYAFWLEFIQSGILTLGKSLAASLDGVRCLKLRNAKRYCRPGIMTSCNPSRGISLRCTPTPTLTYMLRLYDGPIYGPRYLTRWVSGE